MKNRTNTTGGIEVVNKGKSYFLACSIVG